MSLPKLSAESLQRIVMQTHPNGLPVDKIDDSKVVAERYQLALTQEWKFVKDGSSLHCWNEMYSCDGFLYDFIGMVGEGTPTLLVVYVENKDET